MRLERRLVEARSRAAAGGRDAGDLGVLRVEVRHPEAVGDLGPAGDGAEIVAGVVESNIFLAQTYGSLRHDLLGEDGAGHQQDSGKANRERRRIDLRMGLFSMRAGLETHDRESGRPGHTSRQD